MKYTCLTIAAVLAAMSSFCQFGGLGKKLLDKAATASINTLFETPDPITTSFKDVNHTNSLGPDDLRAVYPAQPNIGHLQRTRNGGYALQEGYYYYQAQSYCLKAGTQGPSKGFGYMYAATKGLAEDQVMSIIRNSVNQPNIPQKEIQLLLWAIIAHAKFENLQPRVKATAVKLLTPAQLAQLNRSALDIIPESALNKAKASVPKEIKLILDAENQLRKMLTTTTSSYEDMERVAVLAAGSILSNEETKPGTWTYHPLGYYIRFFPTDYYKTRVELYVPKGSAAVGKEFDPATHIAAPALTGRQRLIMSARYYEDGATTTTPQFPDPVVFEMVPSKGNTGEMIKIVGDNFRSESRIFFGEVETDYIRSMNKTEIYVRVPPNAVTAPIKVISPTSECVSAVNFTVPPIIWAQAITTSLTDAKWATDDMYWISPREAIRSIFELQRTYNGGFVIQTGYYEYVATSFSIKAGRQVTNPSGGVGYLYAPPKGPMRDVVMTILRNCVNQPNIPDADIQDLLDAIMQGLKTDQYTPKARVTASKLLSPRQMQALNTDLPPITDTSTVATNIKQYITDDYWSVHPDGYYIRYKPIDAKTIRIQLWVPQGAPGVGREFDPALHIAVPSDVTRDRIMFTARQRY